MHIYTHILHLYVCTHVCIFLIVLSSEYATRTNCPSKPQYWDKIYIQGHSHNCIQVLLSFLSLGNFWRNQICKPRILRNCWSEINGHNKTTLLMNSDFLKWKQESCINTLVLQCLDKLKALFYFLSSRSETSACLVSRWVCWLKWILASSEAALSRAMTRKKWSPFITHMKIPVLKLVDSWQR